MYLTYALLFIGIGLLLIIYSNVNKFVTESKNKKNSDYESYLGHVSTKLVEKVETKESFIRYYIAYKEEEELILICTLSESRYSFSIYNEDTGNQVKLPIYEFFKLLDFIIPEYNKTDKKESILDKIKKDSNISLLSDTNNNTNVTIIS